MTSLRTAVFLLLTLVCASAQAAPARIAIIIDDLGYLFEEGQQAIALPGDISVSILPNTPHALALAQLAHDNNRDVLLHLPMQAHNTKQADAEWLSNSMNKQAFVAQLRRFIGAVPYAYGVNNHKGSLLTEKAKPMGWLMEELKQWGNVYFIDSRTSSNSIALSQAGKHGIPSLGRHVFLDHDKQFGNLETQFKRLLNRARRKGYAVAIGHPHPETLEFLRQQLPQLAAKGIELVPISQLVQQYSETPSWQASLSPSLKAVKN
ncbi:MAG: divergent polysaccharide deacetylase family protein [Gammaproteobacteria bacterium]|nr:divergent polysaccharide deacetylase family protein [Gammaproteobacteria bacterium]